MNDTLPPAEKSAKALLGEAATSRAVDTDAMWESLQSRLGTGLVDTDVAPRWPSNRVQPLLAAAVAVGIAAAGVGGWMLTHRQPSTTPAGGGSSETTPVPVLTVPAPTRDLDDIFSEPRFLPGTPTLPKRQQTIDNRSSSTAGFGGAYAKGPVTPILGIDNGYRQYVWAAAPSVITDDPYEPSACLLRIPEGADLDAPGMWSFGQYGVEYCFPKPAEGELVADTKGVISIDSKPDNFPRVVGKEFARTIVSAAARRCWVIPFKASSPRVELTNRVRIAGSDYAVFWDYVEVPWNSNNEGAGLTCES